MNKGTQSTLLLLADPSYCLRHRVLSELLGRDGDDPEVEETAVLREEDPILMNLRSLQNPDGSWTALSRNQITAADPHTATAQALRLLSLLSFDSSYEPASRGIEFLLNSRQEDGSWPLGKSSEPAGYGSYTTVSLQTSLPLQGLTAMGLAEDHKCEKSFQWLLDQQLPDGAWPTGKASDVYGYVAGYRRLPHSLWGCRSNTTSAVQCLSAHPELRHSREAVQGMNHLLGRETRELKFFGYDMARLLGMEVLSGFFTFYAHFDLLLILQLTAEMGGSADDRRIGDLVSFFREIQQRNSLWVPSSYPRLKSWATLEILLALKRIENNDDWVDDEPSTPFTPYPNAVKRY